MANDLRHDFHGELEQLRNDVARLGASVVELIPRVTQILLTQDLEGADYVVRADAELDERAVDIEDRALTLLALQAPVAGDLRHTAAALKLAPEIERSADLCANICKQARRVYGHELDAKLRGHLQRMSDQALHEYKEVIEAYMAVDAARASAVPDMDSLLDDMHHEFILQIFESNAAGTIDVQVAVQLAIAGRFYERLGDHAVNISERVRYIATGGVQEHDAAIRARVNTSGVSADSAEASGER